MISPNMATTLGFIVTDLCLTSPQCQTALKHAIDHSYNMLSVDTDQSTNDMVSIQSTGAVQVDLNELIYVLLKMLCGTLYRFVETNCL